MLSDVTPKQQRFLAYLGESVRRDGKIPSLRQAARDLGVDVSTLYRKIKAFGIDVPDSDGRSRQR